MLNLKVTLGPVVQSRFKLTQDFSSTFNSLLIHNDARSSKLVSLFSLSLAAVKLSGKISS